MSDISIPEPPYIRETVPEGDNEDEPLSLEPKHAYKVCVSRRSLTVFFFQPRDKLPTMDEASKLDSNTFAGRATWADGVVLTLVTQDAETALKEGSYFLTDANNTVHFPNPPSSCFWPTPQSNTKMMRELRGVKGPEETRQPSGSDMTPSTESICQVQSQ